MSGNETSPISEPGFHFETIGKEIVFFHQFTIDDYADFIGRFYTLG